MDFNEQIVKLKEKVDNYQFYMQFEKIAESIRRGSGQTYWSLCPLHKDSTPSFMMNMSDGRYVCWSHCIEAGDIIEFYMHYYGVSKFKAVVEIAKWADFELEFDNNYKEELAKKKELTKFNLKLMKHFQENLKNNQSTLDYFKDRGILKSTIETFKLGYHNPNNLLDIISEDEYDIAIKSGVLKRNDDGTVRPFSKVPRIIFPYLVNGYPKTFTSRAIREKDMPKYLNFGNNEFVKKEELIYGIDTAKEMIEDRDCVFIAEGQFDCMKAWQKGIKNTVAVSGIKMSESQINQLKKYTKQFVLCIEDKASEKHIKSSNESIKKRVAWSKVVILKLYDEEKCDLDDYLSNNTVENFLNEVKKSKSYNEYVVEEALKRVKIRDAEDKVRFVHRLKEHLLSVKSIGEREEYIRTISDSIGYAVESIRRDLRNKEIKILQDEFKGQSVVHDPILLNMQKFLIALLFYDISVFTIINKYEEFDIKQYFKPEYLNIYNEILCSLDKGESLNHIKIRLETDVTYKKSFMECINKLDFIILDEDELDDYLSNQIKMLKERRLLSGN